MKKILFMAVFVLLLAPVVSAEEFTETWEVETETITVGEPITEGVSWTAELTWVNQTTEVLSSDSIDDTSFSEEGDQYVAEFSGTILADTPCHGIEPWVHGHSNEYEYRIEARDPADDCPEVTTLTHYDARFHVDEPFKIDVRHGENLIDQLEHPAMEDLEEDTTDAPTEPVDDRQPVEPPADVEPVDPSDVEEGQSPIAGFVHWLRNLF